MENIRVDLNHAPLDGEAVTFKAPCDASEITGLVIYYDGESKAFTLTDANGNDIGVLDNIFAEGAIVKAILDTDGNKAFVQNPNTNTYLENELAKKYSPANKPTAEDVGAASLTGRNTFANPITIDANGNSALDLKWSSNRAYMARFELGYHTARLNAFNDAANLKTYRALGVNDSNKNLANALSLNDVVDNVITEYAVLHTGNKPTGSYTGNGSSEVRRISTGGIGNIIFVTSAEYGSVLVMPNGGIYLNNTADRTAYGRGYFRVEANCTLVIACSDNAINANGVTYTYQVL